MINEQVCNILHILYIYNINILYIIIYYIYYYILYYMQISAVIETVAC